ncbi:MAG: membrane protein insertion efficiency factor YidD [Planctomycetota bacterium]|nr:membrane protein insertion efficiency factor YidD [Planctomycetota bacterium]
MAGCEEGCHPGGGTGHPGGDWKKPPRPAPINPRRRPLSWLAVLLVRCYQGSLSGLWPNVCKYVPSCSHYMIHAIAARGLLPGLLLGIWRLLRCHPLARGGYDPPPGYEDSFRRPGADGRVFRDDERGRTGLSE